MTEAQLLAALPGWELAFVLVLCRVSAAVMLLPGLGEADLPAMLRAGLALAVTVLLVPVVQPGMPPAPQGVGGLLVMVAAELMAGLLLGWLARLVMLALPMAGQIASFMIGQSSVLQPDPAMGSEATALSRLFALAAPVLVLGSGLYALPLSALAGSYHVFPPGTLPDAGDSARAVTASVGASFALALRLAAPFLLAGTVWQVGIGLLARLVPGMQVFFVAQPGQILGGMLVLMLVAGTMLAGWDAAARDAFATLPGL